MADGGGIKMYFIDPENSTKEEREVARHIISNYLEKYTDDSQRSA